MTTKAQRQYNIITSIARLQNDFADNWVDRSLPDDWNFLEVKEPIDPHKTKITMRVDSDMLRWFKKMGPNYQRRINQVLRVYYIAMMQGKLNTHWGFDEQSDLAEQYFDAVLKDMEEGD